MQIKIPEICIWSNPASFTNEQSKSEISKSTVSLLQMAWPTAMVRTLQPLAHAGSVASSSTYSENSSQS